MKSLIIFLQKIWVTLFISVSLAIVIYYLFENTEAFQQIVQFNNIYFFISLIITGLTFLLAVFTWHYLILLNIEKRLTLSFLHSFVQLMLVLLGKYLPGKIWGMVARGALMKKMGLSLPEITSITFQEQILLLHAAGIASCLLLFSLYPSLITGLSVFLFVIFSIKLNQSVQKLFLYLYSHVMKIFKKVDPQKPYILSNQNYSIMILIYIAVWLSNSLLFLFLYLTFIGANLNLELLTWIFLANILSVVIGFLAIFAPGGIGVRESVSSLMLASVMPLEQAIALSLIFRFWLVGIELLLGLITLFLIKTQRIASFKIH